MLRWIDRQMQRGRNLELQYNAYSSRILPSCDDDDDRRCWTWVNRGKRSPLFNLNITVIDLQQITIPT